MVALSEYTTDSERTQSKVFLSLNNRYCFAVVDTRRNTMTMAQRTYDLDVSALKASLRGELIQPGDEGYDAARKVYNGMIYKHPALIARCADVADVIAAVNFGRSEER